MKTLSHQFEALLFAALVESKVLGDAPIEPGLCRWEEPRDPQMGDFASPVAMRLAKQLGENPKAIAEKILEHFPKDPWVGSVEFATPGFLNLKLSGWALSTLLSELEQGFHLEQSSVDQARPVIVEYCSTNAAKPMGAHHIITTVLGDSLANLFEFMGYETLRLNHLGDWGTHFGKMIYAVETWGDREAIHKNPNAEFLKLYVKFNQEAEQNPDLEDEARKIFKELEEGDELRQAMWKWIVEESEADVERILIRMGVHFTEVRGESQYLEASEDVIQDGIQRGIFVEGEAGALVFKLGEDKKPAMLRKGDGTTLYLTRDIATIRYRQEKWHPELVLYVVDHAQSLHFQEVFAVSKALDGYQDMELEHLSFGRMRFADRAMSTRKGNVLILEELLDEAAKRAQDLSRDNDRKDDPALSELIGISSIKYTILSQDRNRDIIFDWDKIITLDGNSAPYLLYAYARANRILEKDTQGPGLAHGPISEPSEIQLIRALVKFPETLEQALVDRKPHHISHYLYSLSQEFNRFYGALPILNAEEKADRAKRLALVRAFTHVLRTGLSILGIPVVEKM